MDLQLINGPASETANADAGEFFEGTQAPRLYRISEALMGRAQDFLEAMFAGRKDRHQIKEAFSTSDFTLAAFAVIDTKMMEKYDDLPSVWREYTDVVTVNDFRPQRLLLKWFETIGLKLVPELTEYPEGGGKGHDTNWINVAKYGLRDAVSWESSINNTAIDEIEAMPTKYANAVKETEAVNALANLLNIDPKTNLASGFNTGFFKAANGNAPSTMKFNADNVDNVLDALNQKVPKGNEKVVVPPEFQIVIPKALERQAQRILNLREIRITEGTQEKVYDNYLKTMDYTVEPMLDAILNTASKATTWFVVPKPGARRPASFAAFLRGYEAPDMRYKANAGQRLGGGDISPLEGSFDVDDIQTRVRHVLGHQNGDPTYTFASDGTAA